MRRALLGLAFLSLAGAPLRAQAVPEGAQAARVQPAYRRTPTFRTDPFRHATIPHWGFVFSAGAAGGNNTLNMADLGAILFLSDDTKNRGGLQPGDVLDIVNLVPEGRGFQLAAQSENGFYLGGPFGGHFSLGLSAQGRAYGSVLLDDAFVALARDGNAARDTFTVGNSRAAGLLTAEAGGHAVLRVGPLSSEDGAHLAFGLGLRMVRPLYYATAGLALSSPGRIRITGDSLSASIQLEALQTPVDSITRITPPSGTSPGDTTKEFSFSKLTRSKGSGVATDLLVRLEWPTSGFALEALVANLGKVNVTGVERRSLNLKVTTTKLDTLFNNKIDSVTGDTTYRAILDTLGFRVKDTTDVDVTLPRIVRFTASAWANRILQVDVSATLPVHGDFESPLFVDVGTTWRLIRSLPLRAGLILGGNQGIGFTGGLAIEGRNMFLQIMGQSLGGLFRNATGGGARLELGTFF